jgi:hypothetical protein
MMYRELSKRGADQWEYTFEERAWEYIARGAFDFIAVNQRVKDRGDLVIADFVYKMWKELKYFFP